MAGFKFEIENVGEVLDVFEELAMEIGDKKARSKILVPAVREAMKPVLEAAKQNAPTDTGGLVRSLKIEARRPNRRDKNSKYVSKTDSVIALVTTRKTAQLKKMGIKSDMRAIAQEFGTAKVPAQPYLRPALEANSQAVANSLGKIIANRIEKFRIKNR